MRLTLTKGIPSLPEGLSTIPLLRGDLSPDSIPSGLEGPDGPSTIPQESLEGPSALSRIQFTLRFPPFPCLLPKDTHSPPEGPPLRG